MTQTELIALQAEIYKTTGQRTDVYQKEGYGVLVVPEYAELTPANLIAVIPELPTRWR